MDTTMIGVHVLSARNGQSEAQMSPAAWIFGVVLDQELDGHARWIIETGDDSLIAQLRSAYEAKSHTDIARGLLVDPLINAID
ncbi:hypothetical protein BH09CHL1_BH09CHL1_12330 [soil metagenome]